MKYVNIGTYDNDDHFSCPHVKFNNNYYSLNNIIVKRYT